MDQFAGGRHCPVNRSLLISEVVNAPADIRRLSLDIIYQPTISIRRSRAVLAPVKSLQMLMVNQVTSDD